MAVWRLDGRVNTGRSFDFSAQDAVVRSVDWTGDGNTLYMIGEVSQNIYRYSAANAFDPSSLTYSGQSININSSLENPTVEILGCVRVSPDGRYLLVSTFENLSYTSFGRTCRIYTFEMSIFNDLSTAVLLPGNRLSGVSTNNGSTISFDLSPDGTTLVVIGGYNSSSQDLRLFQLVTPFVWDYTINVGYTDPEAYANAYLYWQAYNMTLSQTLDDFNFTSVKAPRGVRWNDDGTKIYVCGDDGVNYATKLNNIGWRGWDISADITNGEDFIHLSNITEISTKIQDLWFSNSGASLQLLSDTGTVYEYSLTAAIPAFDPNDILYEGVDSWATIMNIADADSAYASSFSFSPAGIIFTPDGTSIICAMFRYSSVRVIMEFSLATPFVVASATALVSELLITDTTFSNTLMAASLKWDNAGYAVQWMYGNVIYTLPLTTAYTMADGFAAVTSNVLAGAYLPYNGWVYSGDGRFIISASDDGIFITKLVTPYDPSTAISKASGTFNTNWNKVTSAQTPILVRKNPDVILITNDDGTIITIWCENGDWDVRAYTSFATSTAFSLPDLSGVGYTPTSSWGRGYIEGAQSDTILMASSVGPDYLIYRYSVPKNFGGVSSPDGVYVVGDLIVDAGLVVAEKQVQVTLFNDSALPQTCTGFITPTEVSAVSGLALNDVIPQGLDRVVTITIPSDIASNVSLHFEATFDNTGFITEWDVVYSKPLLWSVPHDWGRKFVTTYEWATSITISRDKSEQRRRLRTYPRVIYETAHIVSSNAKHRLLNAIAYGALNSFIVPEWCYMTPILSAVANTDLSCSIDNSRGFFKVNGYAAAYNGRYVTRVYEVQSASASAVSVVGGFVEDMPVGFMLIPANIANISSQLSYKTVTDKVGEAQVSFKSANNLWGFQESSPMTQTYQGASLSAPKPIFDLPSYRGALPALRVSSKRHELDTPTTVTPDIEFVYPQPDIVEQVNWSFKGVDNIDKFHKWLSYIAGSYRDFWIIPEENNFNVVSDIAAATTANAIVVDDDGFKNFYNPANYGNLDIVIETKQRDGLNRFYYRSVTNVVYNSGTDQTALSIDSAIDAVTTLQLSNLKRIGVLKLVRMASDKVSVGWIGPNLINVDMAFINVRY